MARQFNADERRAKREDAEVTIGGVALAPAPQTTEHRAELRKLGAEQAAINADAEKLDKTDDGDDKIAKAAALDERAEQVMYQMIAAMLRTPDGDRPDTGWLADNLAPQDAAPLIEFLQADDEDKPADPS